MCGIFAQMNASREIDRGSIERALTAQTHRGPDDARTWFAPDGRLALAHRRLAIIDPESGRQPVSNEDETILAVVNGELYDFERIRAELAAEGHVFKTGSDSELLVHLYEDLGTDCLERMRGEFAFVLWDSKERLLFAGRDRFGIKPLVYHHDGESLRLASEAKALFAAGVRAAWDRDAFWHAASLHYLPVDRTLFRGVSQLPPGHVLLAREGSLPRIVRYWDCDYPLESALRETSDDDDVRDLRETFLDAVRTRLRTDVPLAFALSGGLDSTAVLAAARHFTNAPLHAFTMCFDDPVYDERHLASKSAGELGAEIHAVSLSSRELLEALPHAVRASEGLAINAHLPAKYLLSKAVRDAGFKVILTGEGADEVFFGYPHQREDALACEDASARASLYAGNERSRGYMLGSGSSLTTDHAGRRLGYVPSFLRAKAGFGARMRTVLHAGLAEHFAATDSCRWLLDQIECAVQLKGRTRLHQSTYLWNKLALAQYILKTLGDGTEMANSIEGRVPFLDHHLFERMRALSPRAHLRGGVEKSLLREALKDIVPEDVRVRTKQPLVAPPLKLDDPDVASYLADWCETGRHSGPSFIDWEEMTALIARATNASSAERQQWDPVILTALSATHMHREFRLEE